MELINHKKQEFKQYLTRGGMKPLVNKLQAISSENHSKLIENIAEVMGAQELSNCTMESILDCCLDLARVGLPLTRIQGYAYVIPFRGKATATISYKGWLLLLKKAGIRVRAEAVYNCDDFSYEIAGFDSSIKIVPNIEERQEDNNDWLHANLKGIALWVGDASGIECHFIPTDKLLQITGKADAIKAKDRSVNIYNTWFIEMMKAKAIKYVASKLPIYDDLSFKKAVELDNKEVIEAQKVGVNNAILDLERFNRAPEPEDEVVIDFENL